MTELSGHADRTGHAPRGESRLLGTPAYERMMLLDLASDLQRWPARNAVFRKALERAACELAQLASETHAP